MRHALLRHDEHAREGQQPLAVGARADRPRRCGARTRPGSWPAARAAGGRRRACSPVPRTHSTMAAATPSGAGRRCARRRRCAATRRQQVVVAVERAAVRCAAVGSRRWPRPTAASAATSRISRCVGSSRLSGIWIGEHAARAPARRTGAGSASRGRAPTAARRWRRSGRAALSGCQVAMSLEFEARLRQALARAGEHRLRSCRCR